MSDKAIVFGLLKRDDSVYTRIVSIAKAIMLQEIICGRADIESVIHIDGWGGYDGIVNVSFEKHFRVNHSDRE